MTTFKIEKYRGQNADFYIQSHGNNAGRPLKKPIRNCFAVFTDKKNAFEIVNCLFISKAFEYYITGSVIPFVRIIEIRKFLLVEFAKNYHSKSLVQLYNIQKLETTLLTNAKKTTMLKEVFAKNIIKEII